MKGINNKMESNLFYEQLEKECTNNPIEALEYSMEQTIQKHRKLCSKTDLIGVMHKYCVDISDGSCYYVAVMKIRDGSEDNED